ncbi:unnamed protein product [Didymodactylos carnosus]|uniref:Uncharacterized protein n=1 Tax=Didymodactylos carnosus TaxID=1234261 RepID=A0A8S2GN49_9BILA|nr:unnamed protein product [Didymodactylos carnosus]CAF3529668.1 unnamed protein product [Didymodactylos carnosus]
MYTIYGSFHFVPLFVEVEIQRHLARVFTDFTYTKHDTAQIDDDILLEIDQWEKRNIERIRQTAEKARERIEELRKEARKETTHKLIYGMDVKAADSECLVNRIEKIKLPLQIRLDSAQSDHIDWSTMITIHKNTPLNFDQLKLRQINSFSSRKKIFAMACTDNLLLYSDGDEKLRLVDRTGTRKMIVEWHNGETKDMCWVSHLNQFIVITTKQVFIVEVESLMINCLVHVKRADRREFGTCDCDDQTLLLGYREVQSPLDEYRTSDWKFVKRWQLFSTSEYVKCIRFMNQYQLAVMVTQYAQSSDGYTLLVQNTFQIRNRSTMKLLKKIENFKFTNFIYLSINRYLVVKRDALVTLDENGNIRKNLSYGKQYRYAVLLGEDCLIIKTENDRTLEFYEMYS